MDTILFYGRRLPYFEFSNFAKYPIIIDQKRYETSEHYYQSKKFEGTKFEEIVRQATSANKAAQLGRRKDLPLRQDWEVVKESVMMTALRAKFSQHDVLKKMLLSTGDKTLMEHTSKDKYWADGGNGTGKNRLGILLMQLRTELRNVD
jgi:N-glycosidase YbiA